MTGSQLTLPTASDDVLKQVEAGIRRLAAENGIIPENKVLHTRPLPVFMSADPTRLRDPADVPDFWRVVVMAGDELRWVDVADEPIGVFAGDGVTRLLEACSAAERLELDGIVSIVGVPAVFSEAVRVTGEADVFLPYAGAATGWPLSGDELVKTWSEAMAALRPGDGREPT